MKVMERMIQKVERTSWSKKIAIEKRYEIVEARLGYPPTRRYRALIGSNDTNTRVLERDWSSVEAYMATLQKALPDPEWQVLGSEQVGIVLSNQVELYIVEAEILLRRGAPHKSFVGLFLSASCAGRLSKADRQATSARKRFLKINLLDKYNKL